MATSTHTKVVIIESLDPDNPADFKSGSELLLYLEGLTEDNPHVIPAILRKVSSENEFRVELRELIRLAKETGEKPILHIETHGYDDASGIVFADGSSCLWSDLKPLLEELNEASKFNLLVCFASCFGAWSLGMIRPMEAAPCWGLIGPSESTDGAELFGAFRAFYRPLLVSGDADSGFEALTSWPLQEGYFLVQIAEDWFYKLIDGYLKMDCTKERINERAKSIHSRIPNKSISIEMIEQIGRNRTETIIDDYFEKFFMVNRIIENRERFSNGLREAKKNAKDFFETQGF
ncbi:hypothetical protein [Undibacterium sp. Tian12W]|uniref:hypothetical protein n=1 Tax=Undibacterium sp. Tian12W TaxID=3413054 RepID=UPI003BF012C7